MRPPGWQNSMATNWPQQANPRAWHFGLATANPNSVRESNCDNWLKMLHTQFMVEALLRWFGSG